MANPFATTVEIEIQCNERFRQQVVEKSDADPLSGVKIRSNETYVLGGESSVAGDYTTSNLIAQHYAISDILNNRTHPVEFFDGPVWLVFEPVNDRLVSLTGCHTIEGVRDPEQRLSVDTTVIVTKHAWITELVRATEEYSNTILDLNPALSENQIFQELQDALAGTRERLNQLSE